MKYNSSACCFVLEAFLNNLIWIHYVHRDNCFAQCVTIVGSQPTFFSITLKSCLHPLRYLNEIFVAFHQWTYDSFSQPLQFDFDSVFTIANVKTPTSLTVLSSSSWFVGWYLITGLLYDWLSFYLDHWLTLIALSNMIPSLNFEHERLLFNFVTCLAHKVLPLLWFSF